MSKVEITYGEKYDSIGAFVESVGPYLIIVNGIAIENSTVYRSEGGDNKEKESYVVSLGLSEQNRLITDLTFSDLPDSWRGLTIPSENEHNEYLNNVRIVFDSYVLDESIAKTHLLTFPLIRFSFRPDLYNWRQPWSALDYARDLKEQISTDPFDDLFFLDSDSGTFGFDLFCKIRAKDAIISAEIARLSKNVNEITTQLQDRLAAQAASNALITRFNFPAIVQTACEQYLLYFVQFLSDLGIEAEANINHQENDVLFNVTPKDKEQALSAIQEALTAYLCIPSSPTFSSAIAMSNDIAVKQLEANVYHFKSQVMLAQAVLQAKDATIDALQLTNFQQRQMLEVAAYNAKEVKAENESVLDGIVEITPYEGKGFIVNFPELIRRLKRSLKPE